MFIWLALSGYTAAAMALLLLPGPVPIVIARQFTLPLVFVLIVTLCGFARPELRFVQSGFASFCDALGGGYTHERIQRILLDPHPGVFAVVGLALVALLQLVLLGDLLQNIPGHPEVTAGLACSQLLPGLSALIHASALPATNARAETPPELRSPQPTSAQLISALVLCTPACAVWLVLQPDTAILAVVALVLFTIWFHFVVRRRLGHAAPASMASVVQIGRLLLLLAATADFARVVELVSTLNVPWNSVIF